MYNLTITSSSHIFKSFFLSNLNPLFSFHFFRHFEYCRTDLIVAPEKGQLREINYSTNVLQDSKLGHPTVFQAVEIQFIKGLRLCVFDTCFIYFDVDTALWGKK